MSLIPPPVAGTSHAEAPGVSGRLSVVSPVGSGEIFGAGALQAMINNVNETPLKAIASPIAA